MNNRRYFKILASIGTSLILLLLFQSPAMAYPGDTRRMSVGSDGTQGNGESTQPTISADGRYVAFSSHATNLVSVYPGTDGIYVHNRENGQTEIVSVAFDGTVPDAQSTMPSISADGRYVAFLSEATNLVSGDTNGKQDIFVHDRQSGQTRRVSITSDGTQANGASDYPSISADGRYVAFQTFATNLISDDSNGMEDIFVHDLLTGQTECISVASDGTQGNGSSERSSISFDGRYVTFYSVATNLVNGDTNNSGDIFIHDRQTGMTERVSVASDGTQGNSDSLIYSSISAAGRFVTFESIASNLVSGDTNGVNDIFVHDRQTGQTMRVSVASVGTQGNGHSDSPSISTDGQYVVFVSHANNLVSGDTNNYNDVFLHDMQTGQTSRVSVASDGFQGNQESFWHYPPSVSANGRFVAFRSSSTNLIGGDTNGTDDVFVHENQVPTRVIWGNVGVAGATLRFDDGGPQTTTTYSDGDYFLEVSFNWSGTVTPSLKGYIFSPAHRTYSIVQDDQTDQNYTATITYPIYLPLIFNNAP